MTTASAPEPAPYTSADQYVGDRLFMEIRRRRLTQTEAAAALGMGQSSLNKKLNGDHKWSLDELLSASRYFSIPVAELLPGDDYEPRSRMRAVGDDEAPGREATGGKKYAIRDSNPEPADLKHHPISTLARALVTLARSLFGAVVSAPRSANTSARTSEHQTSEQVGGVLVPLHTRRRRDPDQLDTPDTRPGDVGEDRAATTERGPVLNQPERLAAVHVLPTRRPTTDERSA